MFPAPAPAHNAAGTENACIQVINLDQAPQGYGEFDAGVPKKFVIDPQDVGRGVMP